MTTHTTPSTRLAVAVASFGCAAAALVVGGHAGPATASVASVLKCPMSVVNTATTSTATTSTAKTSTAKTVKPIQLPVCKPGPISA